MTSSSDRLDYGPRKYAALHLLLARWLRLYSDGATEYHYVTLGGTELRDIQSLRFVDTRLTATILSYETDTKRHKLALERAAQLTAAGIDVEVQAATFFSHKRRSQAPHIFFFDLPGICAWGDYHIKFSEMFMAETIREGDCLLITSHLGHHRGLDEIREHFLGELAILGIDERDTDRVRCAFRQSHPTMTLFKALCLNRIQSEVCLRCFGVVKYRDANRTPMGIYGYSIASGVTDLKQVIGAVGTSYFDMNEGCFCSPDSF